MYVGKKPQNVIESPIQPCIQRDPPRYYQTDKYSIVHADDIMRKQGDDPNNFDGMILAVSKTENQTRYGRSSYTPKVNKEFRPPLRGQCDNYPLSRMPHPTVSVRLNPDACCTLQQFSARNAYTDTCTQVWQDDMIVPVKTNVQAYQVYAKPREDVVVPDLQMKLPSVNASSRCSVPVRSQNNIFSVTLEDKNPSVDVTSGINIPMVEGFTPIDYELEDNQPAVSVGAKIQPPYSAFQTPLRDVELSYTNPQVSAGSKATVPYYLPVEDADVMLDDNNPQVSAHTGFKPPALFSTEIPIKDLEYVNPQTSVSLNMDCPLKIQDYNPQTIRLQDNKAIPYAVRPDYQVRITSHNEKPQLRPTLDYHQTYGSGPVMPTSFINLQPSLKGIKGRA